MRDGMYEVEFASSAGVGRGVVILDGGKAYGGDAFGGRYDGNYTYDEQVGVAQLRLKLSFAANATSVFGITHPHEWSVDATAGIDARLQSGETQVKTMMGHVIAARYRFMRELPVE